HFHLKFILELFIIMLVSLTSQVFDYDFGLQDDFMGSAFLDLTQLELNRTIDVTLTLKDPHYPDHDLGNILLSVVLTPKEGDHRDVVSSPSRSVFLLSLIQML
ncbi:Multiple C2 and transmembrane domain-containing protein 1, partial [Galemys pyrenaicus]